MKIVFASANKNKLSEMKSLAGNSFQILGLQDINCLEEIPETALTLQGNALQKARYVYQNYSVDCFSDDTGLEIDALEGRPGVFSARYAGKEADPAKNIQKVLLEMTGKLNRSARFRTVIAVILDGKEHCFEGIIEGTIGTVCEGVDGFGYDSIFKPLGFQESFAQMSMETKNKISHRAIAFSKLISFLTKSE
jgi:XTP/dITP diphosphohydrolase